MEKNIKRFSIALSLGLVFSFLLSLAGFGACCDSIRRDVIRIHIRANSDSTADQILKMQVKDKIVELSEEVLSGCRSKQEAMKYLEENLESIREGTEKEVRRLGYSYPVRLTLQEADFSTREYENFTLPAGKYDSLCVELGEGAGQNWWCVIFPGFCLGAAAEGEDFGRKQAEVMGGKEKYQVRFKIVEILEDIRSVLNF